MSDRVIIERHGAVAHVQLNRPEKHNGLDLGMCDGILAAGETLMQDKSLRAIVLSGRGPSFCAGLDVASFMSDPAAADRFLERFPDSPANAAQRLAWIWREIPVPVLAALHGSIFGGGMQIALGADTRYVHPDAMLSIMEIKWGLIPDMGLTQTLPGLVRPDIARELTYTGRKVTAEEAVAIGLATRICQDPVAEALVVAEGIANRSPHAIRSAKHLFNQSPHLDTAQSFALETELQVALIGSANQMEAAMANFQKRTPAFKDPD